MCLQCLLMTYLFKSRFFLLNRINNCLYEKLRGGLTLLKINIKIINVVISRSLHTTNREWNDLVSEIVV